MKVEEHKYLICDDRFEMLFQKTIDEIFSKENLDEENIIAFRFVCHIFFQSMFDSLYESDEAVDNLTELYNNSYDYLSRLAECNNENMS